MIFEIMNDYENIIKDVSFQKFIDAETQNQKFQVIVHELTGQCWDMCMEKPSIRLDSKTENCLVNCVGRFLDCSELILNRLGKISASAPASAFD